MHDPRETSPYGRLYTVEYLNNMVGGVKVLYINQPVDVLKALAAKSIKNNQVRTHFRWNDNGAGDMLSGRGGGGVSRILTSVWGDGVLLFINSVRKIGKVVLQTALKRTELFRHVLRGRVPIP